MLNVGMVLALILPLSLTLVSMRVSSLPLNVVVSSLSFKKGDRLDPRNWRLISLLNVDYKLAARVLARRLLKVIHLVVADDQTCGVPGGTLVKMLLFCGMLSAMLLSLDNPLPSFPLIKKRPSIEWIGDSCV